MTNNDPDDASPTSPAEPADAAPAPVRRGASQDDFLVPGPTAESNEGLLRWGLSWLTFSILLMILMLGISFICLLLAKWAGAA